MGTAEYKAPEIEDNGRYDAKVDIFAFGVIAFNLLSGGNHPFATQEEREDIEYVDNIAEFIRTRQPKWELIKCSPQVKNLIDACLKKNPAERPSASQLVAYNAMKIGVSRASQPRKIQISRDIMRYQKRDIFAQKLQNFLSSIMMKQEDLRELTRVFREMD